MSENRELLESFVDAAWAERGLSGNTLKSYRYDLSQLAFTPGRQKDCALLAREPRGHC